MIEIEARPEPEPIVNHYPEAIVKLIHSLSTLPGIGKKTAERLALHILHAPDYEAAALLRQAGGELIGSFELTAAVRQLAERVTDRQQLGVLITNRTAPALCLANRHPGVRAAWGANVEMVRDAVATVGANLLVIDPTGRNLAELTNSVREFKRSATRNCPAEFREVL